MKFARWVFLIAGVLGLLLTVPLFYSYLVVGDALLPDIPNMRMFFYILVVQHVAWQVLFIIVARDPVRYRLMMIPAFFAEVMVPLNPIWLFLYGVRFWIPIAVVSLVLSILFVVAFWLTGREPDWSAAKPLNGSDRGCGAKTGQVA